MNRPFATRPTRRAQYGALALFGLAYLGALIIIFAPEGTLSSRATMAAVEQSE